MDALDNFTQKFLLECFSYSKDTGAITWNTRPRHHFKKEWAWKEWNRKYAGNVAGTKSTQKKHWTVLRVVLNKKRLMCHRLAWKMVTGETPACDIDHKDHDELNNKWANLRLAEGSKNSRNQARRVDNKTGIPGVCCQPAKRLPWLCQLRHEKIYYYLGRFDNLLDAAAAVLSKRQQLGYEDGHGADNPKRSYNFNPVSNVGQLPGIRL